MKQVYAIDFQAYYKKGFRGVMFDVDNTLVPFDVLNADSQLIGFIEELKNIGFQICLVSNNSEKRVATLNEGLGLLMMPNAMKPFKKKLHKALELMGINAQHCIFVGDQIFTDVWVGNRMKMETILVEPIQVKEQLITRIKRGIEKWVLRRYFNESGGKNA